MNKHIKFVAVTALELVVVIGLIIGIHHFFPATVKEKHIIITEKKIRVITEKLTVPKPSNVKYEKLLDASRACTGWPVEIIDITVQADKSKEGESITWMKVRPAGDEFNVACRLTGAWDDMFHKGDLVSLPQGKVG